MNILSGYSVTGESRQILITRFIDKHNKKKGRLKSAIMYIFHLLFSCSLLSFLQSASLYQTMHKKYMYMEFYKSDNEKKELTSMSIKHNL